MIREYLEELYEELYAKKIDLQQQIQKRRVDLQDNIKLVNNLEHSIDEDFESFSPKNYNQNNYNKIQYILENQKTIQDEIDSLKNEILIIDSKIEKLDCVINDFRQNQGYTSIPLIQSNFILNDDTTSIQKNDNTKIEMNLFIDSLLSDLSVISHKIINCSNLVSVDPKRCKLELLEIDNNLNSIINKINDI